MQAARDRQKSYADLKRKPMEFQVGDKVMLKVSPWQGVLELPEELSRVHNTFHVSNLKKCYANEPLAVSLDGLHFDDKLPFVDEPVEIMNREVRRLKRIRIPLVKIFDTIMLDFEDSMVTYTAVSSPYRGLSDIGSPGVDGPPVMPQDPYVYVVAAFQAPPSPDYVPGPKEPHAPLPLDFVSKPIYPKFMPPEDESDPEEDLEEDDEDPEEDPTDYPADRDDDDEEEEEEEPSEDDADDEDEDEEEEEEHPALADSVPPVHHTLTTTLTVGKIDCNRLNTGSITVKSGSNILSTSLLLQKFKLLKKERKAKKSLSDGHSKKNMMRRIHGMDDTKEIWEASETISCTPSTSSTNIPEKEVLAGFGMMK
ncbi:hypothetical protein Tco_0479196 [Tanacetum coccineum]